MYFGGNNLFWSKKLILGRKTAARTNMRMRARARPLQAWSCATGSSWCVWCWRRGAHLTRPDAAGWSWSGSRRAGAVATSTGAGSGGWSVSAATGAGGTGGSLSHPHTPLRGCSHPTQGVLTLTPHSGVAHPHSPLRGRSTSHPTQGALTLTPHTGGAHPHTPLRGRLPSHPARGGGGAGRLTLTPHSGGTQCRTPLRGAYPHTLTPHSGVAHPHTPLRGRSPSHPTQGALTLTPHSGVAQPRTPLRGRLPSHPAQGGGEVGGSPSHPAHEGGSPSHPTQGTLTFTPHSGGGRCRHKWVTVHCTHTIHTRLTTHQLYCSWVVCIPDMHIWCAKQVYTFDIINPIVPL